MATYVDDWKAKYRAKVKANTKPAIEGEIKVGSTVRRKSGDTHYTGRVLQLFTSWRTGKIKAKVHWDNGARWLGNRADGTASNIAIDSLVLVATR